MFSFSLNMTYYFSAGICEAQVLRIWQNSQNTSSIFLSEDSFWYKIPIDDYFIFQKWAAHMGPLLSSRKASDITASDVPQEYRVSLPRIKYFRHSTVSSCLLFFCIWLLCIRFWHLNEFLLGIKAYFCLTILRNSTLMRLLKFDPSWIQILYLSDSFLKFSRTCLIRNRKSKWVWLLPIEFRLQAAFHFQLD